MRSLFENDRGYRAAVSGLSAVAGIATVRIDDPRLIIPWLKNIRTKLRAKPATDAKIQIDSWSSHNVRYPFSRFLSTDTLRLSFFAVALVQ